MRNYLVLLVFISTYCHAFNYGKVRIDLSENQSENTFSLGIIDEQSNDLIDSQGIEFKYLRSIKSNLKAGIRYSNFDSKISSNGKRVKNDLLDNGIIQNLELKQSSIFIESSYRLANGVMKFVGSRQAQIFIDIGLGLGSSTFENTKDNKESSTTGWLYSLELGANLSENYVLSLYMTKIQDGVDSKNKINQTFLGMGISYLW